MDSEDIVRARKVQLGIVSDGLRVIRDGLQQEDRVVLDGLANPAVRPGAKVSPQSAEIQAVSSN